VREDIITFAEAKLFNADPAKVEELSDAQKLACLSQRIPLELKSTNYIAQANERKQVEGHMHTCLKINASFKSMVSMSVSELLLSEAAYSIMACSSFNIPKVMKSVLEGFSIDKGDHGEFLTMLLFTITCDMTVGPPTEQGSPTSQIVAITPFLGKNLFKHNSMFQELHTDFPTGKMHFNHYIKVHKYAVIDTQSLLLLSS
jgi:hypothetical protein